MAIERVEQSWSNSINVVTIGNGKNEVKVGGENVMPFLNSEGDIPNPPVIALDVFDTPPGKWTEDILNTLGDIVDDPLAWAKKGSEAWGVDLISLHLTKHGDENDPIPPEKCAELAKTISDEAGLPLIIWGSGNTEADNEMYPLVSQALAGQRCLFGSVTEDNYKTLAATCIADGHNLIGESPIDINMCKQVNILVSDMGFPLDKIVIFTANGALGYGLEYAYSIMERTRLAALGGDKLMAMPIIANIGPEVQRAKEVKASEDEYPEWGSRAKRGVAWETTTAVSYLQAGTDILTMSNPEAIKLVKEYIAEFFN